MNGNDYERLVRVMADYIIEDSLNTGRYWCNGCSKVGECPWSKPRDCVIASFWKDLCERGVLNGYENL